MVAKMLLLAASASVALASASARTLSQARAGAKVYQISRSFSDERVVEGTTDLDVYFPGAGDVAYADAEGLAAYRVGIYGGNNFAGANTVAETRSTNEDSTALIVPVSSLADSVAISDGAAQAKADSVALAEFSGASVRDQNASADALSSASAQSDDFSGAKTEALAYGVGGADASAFSLGISEGYTETEATAEATSIGYGIDSLATSLAVARSDSIGEDEGIVEYAKATADATSLTPGEAADANAISRAYNDEEAAAASTAQARTERAGDFSEAGTATSRARSFAGGQQAIPNGLHTTTIIGGL